MYQSYQGQVRNGQPMVLEQVKLPENARIIITILDDKDEIITQKQRRAFEKFAKAVAAAPPLGEEFDKVINQGTHILRELDL